MTNVLALSDALRRHAIGFNRFENMAASAANYPPYNIERISEDTFRLTLAVAGFSKDDLTITLHMGTLVVVGDWKSVREEETEFVHRGLSLRPWEHKFSLGQHVTVTKVTLENGLLEIELTREVPESEKPKLFPID